METLEENISILRDHYPPLAGIPEAQLLRLPRTYELDSGDRYWCVVLIVSASVLHRS